MGNFRLIGILFSAVLLFSGCVRVYKLDIQQGNDLTGEQVSQVKVGMNQIDVRQLLGTPVVADPFHQDRWDYFYTFRSGGKKEMEKRQLVLFFENQQLQRIEGAMESETIIASKIDMDDLQEEGLTRKERRELRKKQKEGQPGFMDRLRLFARRIDGEE
ncbi:MAG: outer membrane protein assembly factor BamE [Parasphingorhabdus sp.]|jgi:outer membrane protein assembly factor BamE